MAPKPYLTLDDLDVSGKTVLLRLDLNSPIVGGRVASEERIAHSVESLVELQRRSARVVVLSHQGRKGGEDFTSLREHAEILSRRSGVPLRFVPDVAGPLAQKEIAQLRDGEVVLLENVRSIDDETKRGTPKELSKVPFVQTLASLASFYINDAFSASHRGHASLVGFPELLPSAAGVGLDRELEALSRAVDNPASPSVYVLGGAKPEDSMAVLRANFGRGTLSLALLGGLVGNLFLVARGHDLGRPSQEFLEKKKILDLLPEAEELLEKYDEKIVTPEDIAYKGGSGERRTAWIEELPLPHPILDIGPRTLETYRESILEAGSLFLNGPMGAYEEKGFDEGTRGVLWAAAESRAFSLLGGGHTVSAISHVGLSRTSFGHVSLAGGALLSYLSGEKLPGLQALEESARRYGSGGAKRTSKGGGYDGA